MNDITTDKELFNYLKHLQKEFDQYGIYGIYCEEVGYQDTPQLHQYDLLVSREASKDPDIYSKFDYDWELKDIANKTYKKFKETLGDYLMMNYCNYNYNDSGGRGSVHLDFRTMEIQIYEVEHYVSNTNSKSFIIKEEE